MHTIEAGATYHRLTSSTAFEWSRYGKLHSKFKLNLRHLFSNLDFAGLVELATTHAIHPPTRTLVLIEMEEEIPIPNVGMEDAVLEALDGPQTFLSVIDRMLWAILCFRRPLDSSPAFR
jgi:hypothetical protein